VLEHITQIARILNQIKNGSPPVPVEILAQAKAKEPPTDALPRFLEAYTSHTRVGTLTKEAHSGKLVDEWNKLLSDASQKPEGVEIGPSISSFMACKDDDEQVRG
jgi:nucleosome binding factor SPN SPT16 subunit